ncbi:FadR/GntR family transcriptional regulator [Streptomyces sp. MBT62]|uniref:FadR/GntR family transcriptional regulator n=1 Tax=Streptomyces sp. MBT62 TaxID=2800410 RepID=UPI00190979D9|nr:FadR/GntR family transcriptional regulator [Streptomyces sp. MBT62]MBK3563856.1 FadR family transcriptional regulator [Streptomyces sp. MBT62]MBK6012415.1 FadR family transcriptional regulator [Streptomyces sp. MBT53]
MVEARIVGAAKAGALQPWPKRPARLAPAVVEALVDQIVARGFPPGTTLPVEPDLCAVFGVSRTTIREAVKSLEAKGLVRARQGQGTTVTEPENWNLLDPVVLAATVQHDDELVILDQLVGVRSALESQMAAQAARSATSDDLRSIETLLTRLDVETAQPASFVETDVAFHDRIMQASGNILARSIVRIVHVQARTTTLYNGIPDRAACALSNDEHRHIWERLVARDAEGAAQAMSGHIETAWQRRRSPAMRVAEH